MSGVPPVRARVGLDNLSQMMEADLVYHVARGCLDQQVTLVASADGALPTLSPVHCGASVFLVRMGCRHIHAMMTRTVQAPAVPTRPADGFRRLLRHPYRLHTLRRLAEMERHRSQAASRAVTACMASSLWLQSSAR